MKPGEREGGHSPGTVGLCVCDCSLELLSLSLSLTESLELEGVMDLIVYMGESPSFPTLSVRLSLSLSSPAARVFKVTQLQMAVLLLVKMLGQRTLETYIHQSVGDGACCHGYHTTAATYNKILSLISFVSRKVELLSQERILAELIALIRGQRSFE